MQNRRAHLRSLLGMAALAGMPRAAHAEDPPIPPEGIGHRIKHLSYSDIGGRPDSIQIMSNRNHLYVGHMFSDGVTILDASDPLPDTDGSFSATAADTGSATGESGDGVLARTTITVKNTSIDSITVMTMWLVTVKEYGIKPIMFMIRMNINNVNTNGKNFIPSVPAVVRTVVATNS